MSNEHEPPVSLGVLRAALNAIHEAYGTPVTRCLHANAFMREYPDYTDASLQAMLAFHDRGVCDCEHYRKGPSHP